ncbi:MAG: glycosyltransferase family 4 protein [Mesorhizobium sp.]|uniref:glycosyltransferase n=2 Tax=unclassified Mesorhizobium TaxID=325217 RepID=UPI000FE2D5F2|nr:glycosyltransferase [Mesorhizobium sp.]RWK08168.1 MAG: glycosyltransferase family 1 protein [Mesorhizobium sp.]RWK15764.1 MAG: glycosyltransferase family 1 protein [Mesorhizobium sp.]RWK26629.1 MAG: glycosyltransferase family 1 protein [Mesorhizobium sp.]TIQ42096.1 MAG: glycosyltransferase family 4 protein [Mesorhizobium sp.]
MSLQRSSTAIGRSGNQKHARGGSATIGWIEPASVDLKSRDAEGKIEAAHRLRIAHVITRLINGGADENTVYSCNWAAQRGHDVFLLHGEAVHPEIVAKVDPRVELIGIPDLTRSLSPASDVRALLALTLRFRALNADIVHTHTSKAGILGRFAAWAAGVPVIIHGVHIVPFVNVGVAERLTYLALEKLAAPVTSAFISVSEGIRDLCMSAGVGHADKHHVVYSGFDLDRFRNASPPADWRELLRLTPDAPRPRVLLMIAAFEPRKRHAEFLEVFKKVAVRLPDTVLVLAGDGPLRSIAEQQVNRLGLQRRVVFAGYRDDPERLIALADLCLLCSIREGLPRVLMQYLAGGKPCVACDLPGLREVLRPGTNSVITPPDDLGAMADTTATLLEDRERLACLARGAAATDLSNWDANRMGKQIDAIYRQALNQHLASKGASTRPPVRNLALPR